MRRGHPVVGLKPQYLNSHAPDIQLKNYISIDKLHQRAAAIGGQYGTRHAQSYHTVEQDAEQQSFTTMTSNSTDDLSPDGSQSADTATDEETDDEATDWPTTTDELHALADRLDERTVSLRSTDPTGDLDDLDPLADRFARARIVGLGEATHGTREFFRAKHRLIRFLVERLDYRLLALEANVSETMAIDEYVVHGRGDPKDALDGIYFWTWDTEEVLALLEWLREFNDGRPVEDCVRFYGIDAQFTGGPAEALTEFLDEYDPELLAEHEDALAILADEGPTETGEGEEADGGDEGTESEGGDGGNESDAAGSDVPTWITAGEDLVAELEAWFEDGRPGDAGADPEDIALHRHHLQVLDQALDGKRAHHEDDMEAGLSGRDRAMAANLSWVLDHEPHDRVAVWAHDEHLQTVTRDTEWGTWTPMGVHLEEWYDDYYAVGFDFADGEFQAMVETDDGYDLQACSLGPPPADAATRLFAATDDTPWFLHFEDVADVDRLADYLDSERPTRSLGAVYDPDGELDGNHTSYRLPESFDGLVFVDETTRAEPVERDVTDDRDDGHDGD